MANTREYLRNGTSGTYARANTDEWYYDSASGLFKNASSNQIRPAPEMTMKYHSGTTSDSTKHTPVSRTIREGIFFEDGQTILISGGATVNNYQKAHLYVSTAVWSDVTASPPMESTGYCKCVVDGAAGDNNPYWEPKFYFSDYDWVNGDLFTAQYLWKPITTAIDSLTDTLIIPGLSIYCYGDTVNFTTDYWNINPIENYVSHENGINCSNCENVATGWIELPNGWYIIFATIRVTTTVNSGWVSMTCYPTCYTLPYSYLHDGQPDVTGEFYIAGWSTQRGGVHSPYKVSSNADITTVSDTITHTPTAALGSNGRTFGISGNPLGLFSNTEAILETTALDTAGKFQVKIQAQADGDLDFSAKDSGASAITATDTKADTDIGSFTTLQIELEGSGESATAEFFKDGASLGTAAAHSIADADQLEGDDIVLGGFGGVLYAVAFDDTSDQADNLSYIDSVNQYLEAADTASITGVTSFSRGQSFSVTDTINAADAASRIQNLQLNAASSVAITGAISRTLAASMAKTDTVNLADATTLGQNLALSLADTFNQADTVQRASALALSIADSLNLTDAVTRVLGASLTVNDSFNTGDVDAFVQGLLESYTDTITLTEAVTILVIQIITSLDTLNLSDAFSAQLTAIKTATDTIQLSDALTSLLQAAASHSDFVQYADALTATANFVKSFTDTINVIDAITMSSQAIKALSDTLGLTDTTALVSALAKAHTDTFTLADVIGLQLGLTSIFESGVSFGDAVTIREPQLVSLSDTIQFWDWAGFTASATATPTFTLAGIVVAASVTMLAVNVVPNINISGLRIDPSVGLDSVDIT